MKPGNPASMRVSGLSASGSAPKNAPRPVALPPNPPTNPPRKARECSIGATLRPAPQPARSQVPGRPLCPAGYPPLPRKRACAKIWASGRSRGHGTQRFGPPPPPGRVAPARAGPSMVRTGSLRFVAAEVRKCGTESQRPAPNRGALCPSAGPNCGSAESRLRGCPLPAATGRPFGRVAPIGRPCSGHYSSPQGDAYPRANNVRTSAAGAGSGSELPACRPFREDPLRGDARAISQPCCVALPVASLVASAQCPQGFALVKPAPRFSRARVAPPRPLAGPGGCPRYSGSRVIRPRRLRGSNS